MRQAGVLAAAGLYALEHHVRLLEQDHANAEFLSAGLRGLGLDVEPVQTNMLYAAIPAAEVAALKSHLEQRGILATVAPRTRLVTHLDLSREKIGAGPANFPRLPTRGLKGARIYTAFTSAAANSALFFHPRA